jgi:hypothetical protein
LSCIISILLFLLSVILLFFIIGSQLSKLRRLAGFPATIAGFDKSVAKMDHNRIRYKI